MVGDVVAISSGAWARHWSDFRPRLFAVALLAQAVAASACGDDSGDGSASTGGDSSTSATSTTSTASTGTGAPTSSSTSASTTGSSGDASTTTAGGVFQVSGRLEYESIPYDPDGNKLNYGAIEKRPIRGVNLSLIDADSEVELASTVSDELGAYSFEYTDAAEVKIWVFAETATPAITIEDNTDSDTIYVMESAVIASSSDAKLDVLAATGWTGDSYGAPRNAAPFAVLDAVYGATGRFLAETTPAPAFVPLRINWSVDNRPEGGDLAAGQIGTSHWDNEELYILGKEDVDTDEFDTHIVVHEWCHAFQSTITRSDSRGGAHAEGDVLDPRVAWSEGSCNAMSAILLDPNFLYTDTFGQQQGESFIIDLETNQKGAENNPGWFAERTVGAILLDVYDTTDEPFDKLSVGLQGVYEALVTQAKLPAFTTLFSFIAPLKAANPQDAAKIDALLVYHTASPDFGVSPINDPWGTGETHAGDAAGNLPVYTEASVGGMYMRELIGGAAANHLAQNRYFSITGDGMTILANSTCAEDVDLEVFHLGQSIAVSDTVGNGNEDLEFDTIEGEVYVVVIQGFNDVPGPYTATLSLSH